MRIFTFPHIIALDLIILLVSRHVPAILKRCRKVISKNFTGGLEILFIYRF